MLFFFFFKEGRFGDTDALESLICFQLLNGNYHKFSRLEQYEWIVLQILWGRSLSMDLVSALLGVSPGWHQGVGLGYDLIWDSGRSSTLTDCWENSIPCGCSTEVLALWLAMGWGQYQLLQVAPSSLSHSPLHSCLQHCMVVSPTCSFTFCGFSYLWSIVVWKN